jgi:hypothetical protein
MGTATLTRRRPRPDATPEAPARAARRITVPAIALSALVIAAVIGFIVYPTFPNYDSYYSLLWGRELLGGHLPSFDTYRAPTEHPLAVVFGALLSLLGDPADRVLVGATVVSFIALAAGMYRLASVAFTPLVGLVAAALVCTRFDFPFLAARGYIDIPYLAFVVWAGALEAARQRRGLPVYALLICAGLMRPEAWLLTGLYWLWCLPRATWRQRIGQALLVGVAPVLWFALDAAATGDPLFSLHHTSGLAEELGRQRTLSEVPSATVQFLRSLTKAPVFYGGILGVALAASLTPRRAWMPATLLIVGLGTFGLVGLAGLSVIDRYLLVPSLMVMVFAGVALAGWTMLERGRVRTAWMGLAGLLVVYGVVFTATHVNLSRFENELAFRGDAHAALEEVLRDPKVRAGLACGPVSVPNHKLIPDVRWVLDVGARDTIARSDASQGTRSERGVQLFPAERTALLRQALVSDTDDPLLSVPGPGFLRVATSDFYGAYVRC